MTIEQLVQLDADKLEALLADEVELERQLGWTKAICRPTQGKVAPAILKSAKITSANVLTKMKEIMAEQGIYKPK